MPHAVLYLGFSSPLGYKEGPERYGYRLRVFLQDQVSHRRRVLATATGVPVPGQTLFSAKGRRDDIAAVMAVSTSAARKTLYTGSPSAAPPGKEAQKTPSPNVQGAGEGRPRKRRALAEASEGTDQQQGRR
ncbi:uncharacterized protein LOC144146504 [Haemaphysalis longicornis]